MAQTLLQFFLEACQDHLSPALRQNMAAVFGRLGRAELSALTAEDRNKFMALARSSLGRSLEAGRVDGVMRGLETRLSAELATLAFAHMGKKSEPRSLRPSGRFKAASLYSKSERPKSPVATRRISSLKRSDASEALSFPVNNVKDIVRARSETLRFCVTLGFSRVEAVKLATCVSELARNIVLYAGSGELRVDRRERFGSVGVTVFASDSGPGIANIDAVLSDSYQSRTGLGKGLKAVKELGDEFDIKSSPGRGTKVTMTKWFKS